MEASPYSSPTVIDAAKSSLYSIVEEEEVGSAQSSTSTLVEVSSVCSSSTTLLSSQADIFRVVKLLLRWSPTTITQFKYTFVFELLKIIKLTSLQVSAATALMADMYETNTQVRLPSHQYPRSES